MTKEIYKSNTDTKSGFSIYSPEVWVQVGLALIFFLGNSFRRYGFEFDGLRVLLYFNYLAAAFVINYFLLQKFFYQKQFFRFAIGVVLVLLVMILIEELVLEPWLFAGTRRAARFPGIVYSLMYVVPMLMVFVGFKAVWDMQRKQTELEQLKSAIGQSQLQFLKSQINPHFLFNNLNNLYSYSLESSPKVPKIILELSSLLRYMLYDCQEEKVLLSKEIEFLENFVRLQELQIEERGNVTFNVSGIPSNKRIAPLILIVFIENCFKHSTASQSDLISVSIALTIDNDTLTLNCTNSFSPDGNTNQLASGIGLENVKKRLALLYPNAHNLSISKREKEYEANLILNL